MIETLVNVLGWQMVSQALRERDKANDFNRQNGLLVSDSCKTLDNHWKNGTPKACLESLPSDLRNCLICNLVDDVSADLLADDGLIQV
ncbi:MAG: hypothetical protein ACK456_00785 [Pseudanabaenaceae cyanobacterium]|jgi:hypothetical protein